MLTEILYNNREHIKVHKEGLSKQEKCYTSVKNNKIQLF